MEIQYVQDEALVKEFYITMFHLLPISKKRKILILLPLFFMAFICLAVALMIKNMILFAVFLINLLLIATVLHSIASEKTADKIAAHMLKQYGTNQFFITMRCEEEEIVGVSEQLRSDFFFSYADISSIVYNDRIYCITAKQNTFFFPISAIPGGKDVLTTWLTSKNPRTKVIAL